MQAIAFYKSVILILLVSTGGTAAGGFLYYQQQNAQLNNKISTLTDDLNSTQHQVSRLSNQVAQLQNNNTQLFAIINTNNQLLAQTVGLASIASNDVSQLQHQVTILDAKVTNLTQQITHGQTATISQGAISLSGYGAAEYVPFTVQSNLRTASLNVSFSVSGGYSIRSVLLSQSQYSDFLSCNCIAYGNYTTTSWLSPTAQSYVTTITVPYAGAWSLAFIEPPGTGSGVTISETVKLTTIPSTGRTIQTVSSGSISVAFNGISYVSFSVTTLPAILNVTYQIGGYNSYYPQSIALYLLDPTQHALFEAGNYTSSTWSYPYSTSISNTQVIMPSSGTWYVAFQEQDPNGGFPATANYVLQLNTLT